MKVRVQPSTVVFLLSLLSFGGCLCTPSSPKAVTLRLKNTTRDAVYVDDSSGKLGMQLQRSVTGTWVNFAEVPACACLACDQVCSGCSCAPVDSMQVLKVPGGTSFERSWAGVVQLESTAGCGGF